MDIDVAFTILNRERDKCEQRLKELCQELSECDVEKEGYLLDLVEHWQQRKHSYELATVALQRAFDQTVADMLDGMYAERVND